MEMSFVMAYCPMKNHGVYMPRNASNRARL